jgi:hypothetical protein
MRQISRFGDQDILEIVGEVTADASTDVVDRVILLIHG